MTKAELYQEVRMNLLELTPVDDPKIYDKFLDRAYKRVVDFLVTDCRVLKESVTWTQGATDDVITSSNFTLDSRAISNDGTDEQIILADIDDYYMIETISRNGEKLTPIKFTNLDDTTSFAERSDRDEYYWVKDRILVIAYTAGDEIEIRYWANGTQSSETIDVYPTSETNNSTATYYDGDYTDLTDLTTGYIQVSSENTSDGNPVDMEVVFDALPYGYSPTQLVVKTGGKRVAGSPMTEYEVEIYEDGLFTSKATELVSDVLSTDTNTFALDSGYQDEDGIVKFKITASNMNGNEDDYLRIYYAKLTYEKDDIIPIDEVFADGIVSGIVYYILKFREPRIAEIALRDYEQWKRKIKNYYRKKDIDVLGTIIPFDY